MVRAPFIMNFMLPVPEASLPAVETCSERSAAGQIFSISESRFAQIRARHVSGKADPYVLLGVSPSTPFADIKRRYRQMVFESHPDRLIARGVPQEFLAIANTRLAALNGAFEQIERSRQPA